MGKRTRIPGPIARDQNLGNSGRRVEPGISKWQSLDVNDGSWTLYDPNNTLVSCSTSTSGMRIQVNKTNNNLRWNNTNQQLYRYHRRLVGPDGEFLSWSDFFSVDIMVKLETLHANSNVSNNECDHHGVMVGIASNDVTDSVSAINWAGAGPLMHYDDSAGLRSVVGGDAHTINDQNASCEKILAHISAPLDEGDADGNPSTRHLYCFCIDSNDRITGTGNSADASRPNVQTHEYTGTDNVYLFLAGNFGSTANTGSIDNPDATWKVWYRINQARDRIAPSYIPGGGESG
tara:strand:+ start:34737 stop:35606 length:870 start_codon:yes stop_codon:yes gene_type:complete